MDEDVRNFVDAYYHETLHDVVGPARLCCRKHRITPAMMPDMFVERGRELNSAEPPIPTHFAVTPELERKLLQAVRDASETRASEFYDVKE